MSKPGWKDDYDRAQEAIQALLPEADAIVRKVWDEVETYFNEESPASKRRKAREWGVIYVSEQTISLQLTITNQATGLPIAGAVAEVVETGNTQTSDANGIVSIITNAIDAATINITHPGYQPSSTALPLVDGQAAYTLAVALQAV